MSHEKYFDVVQKLKLVCINVIFLRNGAPYQNIQAEKIKTKKTVKFFFAG